MTTATDDPITDETLEQLATVAQRLRRHSLVSTHAAGSGHPTSCLSCADLVAALFFGGFLRFDPAHPQHPGQDRFVLSKGHAAPILWAALAEAGAFPIDELETLRRVDSDLEGHPTPRSPWVDVATGSLGQGLSVAAGMAWYLRWRGIGSHVWTLLGDSETAEGSVWEAAELAAHERLGNLTAIVDVNRLGQTGETMLGHHLDAYAARFAAFGWRVLPVDGHDLRSICLAYQEARVDQPQPVAILARTLKGKGVSFLENVTGHHGKAVTGDDYERALAEIGDPGPTDLVPVHPDVPTPPPLEGRTDDPPEPGFSEAVATREAYAEALDHLVALDDRVLVFDAELSNSTKTELIKDHHPQRFLECYIAEQNMVGMATGAAAMGAIPFVSTFASFLTRAADQIRMAAISQTHLVLAGSHAGVSIGPDGPSQMGLEDLALFRALPHSTVLCPCDGMSAARLVPAACDHQGIVYLRLARPKTPLHYDHRAEFHIGGSHVLRESDDDRVTVIACGVCVDEALQAGDRLTDGGIPTRVIDAYSIKPLDVATVRAAAEATGAVVVVEDHYPEGGLGDAVCAALAGVSYRFRHLAVRELPRSAKPDEQLRRHGIGAAAIEAAVHELSA